VDFCAAGRLESGAPTIVVHGILYDGDGNPIDDAQIEAWLPEAAAAESAQEIPGFRRTPTGKAGEFSFRLSVPPRPAGEPVAYVTVFARGLTKHQFTAVFLEDDATLAESAILAQVPADRRDTLVARKDGDGTYRWDIWMQTEKETVFFDYV
jgi:protocatechuate 3,4-dioxygenase alpha subunit